MEKRLNIDEAAAARAGADYGRLMLDPLQRTIVEDIAGVVARHTTLEEIPTRGFFWQAIKRWQKANRKPIREMRTMPPEEKGPAAREIVRHFEDIVAPLLASDDEREALAAGLQRAFVHYMENYGQN